MSETSSTISPEVIWNFAVSMLRNKLETDEQRNQMERHFSMFLSRELVGNEYRIGVAEDIQVEMFTPKYAELIQNVLRDAGLTDVVVKFVVSAVKPVLAPVQRIIPSSQPQPEASYQRPVTRSIPSTLPLQENYTFDNFVKGPSNSYAHAIATAVAKAPGRTSYNPLFIYGGTGLGKTHLMQAIGHYVLKNNPNASVCFITSEVFLNEYVSALANNAMPAFRDRYRKVDLLLLDDVQFIADKKQFQEEFFNTFNSLMLYQKQVVMTSDVAPKDLKGCEERLTGRFQQGMVVEIESPSYETRLAILKFKAQSTNRIIPEDALKYIAENIRSHVRAIEGALSRIVSFMEMNGDLPLSMEIVHHLLKDAIEQEKTIKDLTVEAIMKIVEETYGVSHDDIMSSKRTQTLVTPRQVAMFLSCKLTARSLTEIGSSFEKTHATVYHGAQTIQKRLDVEADLRKQVENLTSQLGRNPSDLFK